MLSRAGVTTTIHAMLPQPLVVQVNGSDGRLLANACAGSFSTAIFERSGLPAALVPPAAVRAPWFP
ncbi:hypothetical protein [Longimicrobium sp.]|uniref:hypothetical protein n=1 Tax=Longimicrobium sp. TaxID=2029185 RepID=UPI002ED86C23